MGIPTDIILIASGAGAIQSGVFSAYLLSSSRSKNISLKILGFLMLAATLRILESLSYFVTAGFPIIPIGNIGFASHVAIAPLLYFYLRSSIGKDFVFKKSYWFHFFPALMVLIFARYLGDDFWFGDSKGFLFTLGHFGVYLIFAIRVLFSKRNENRIVVSNEKMVWLLLLIIGITIVWSTYGAALVLELISCINGPFIFSFLIYGLSFFGLTHSKMFVTELETTEKYRDSLLTENQIKRIVSNLERYLVKEKGFCNPSLSLPKLAKHLEISTHTLSEVVNRNYKMSFNLLVTSYRIKAAKEALRNPKNKNKKIDAIAYECGFGTTASFYKLFKKDTGFTPSAFRQKS